jgi:cephalosporin hydroxylase
MRDYKFSLDFWNEYHHCNFDYIKRYFEIYEEPVNLLEIGVFEGRTSIWLAENVLNIPRKDSLITIDPDVATNYLHNVRQCPLRKHLRLMELYSFDALTKAYQKNYSCDFIYIDGDHNACGVLEDAILAWRLLKRHGIMLFDDYLMEVKDPWFYISHKEFTEHRTLTWQHPRTAIDAFLNIYKGQYEVVINNYQIGIQKICELGEKNLNHGDNTQKFLGTLV